MPQVWQLGSPHANFSLEGHQRGVNCVDYSHGGDKPYLISGADDCLVKVRLQSCHGQALPDIRGANCHVK